MCVNCGDDEYDDEYDEEEEEVTQCDGDGNHTCDVGVCCECGDDHCCQSSFCGHNNDEEESTMTPAAPFTFPHMADLEGDLLALAKKLGQCFARDKESRRCVRVNGHQGDHGDEKDKPWKTEAGDGYVIMSSEKNTGNRALGTAVYSYSTGIATADRLNDVLVNYDHWCVPSSTKLPKL